MSANDTQQLSYAELRIHFWARWMADTNDGAIGYPRKSSFLREGSRATGQGTSMVNDEEALQVNKIIEGLKATQPGWYATVHCYYIGDPNIPGRRRRAMTQREIATKLWITERTVRNYLDRVIEHVDTRLRD